MVEPKPFTTSSPAQAIHQRLWHRTADQGRQLRPHPAGKFGCTFTAAEPLRLIILRKCFEAVSHLEPPDAVHGHDRR